MPTVSDSTIVSLRGALAGFDERAAEVHALELTDPRRGEARLDRDLAAYAIVGVVRVLLDEVPEPRPSRPGEVTLEDFGYICEAGHYDCADDDDGGPCAQEVGA